MKYKKEVYRSLALIMQFGINMIVPILLCTFLGVFLDRLFDTSFITVILFFLGAIAGFRNIYIFAKSIYDKPYKGQYSSYDDPPAIGGGPADRKRNGQEAEDDRSAKEE